MFGPMLLGFRSLSQCLPFGKTWAEFFGDESPLGVTFGKRARLKAGLHELATYSVGHNLRERSCILFVALAVRQGWLELVLSPRGLRAGLSTILQVSLGKVPFGIGCVSGFVLVTASARVISWGFGLGLLDIRIVAGFGKGELGSDPFRVTSSANYIALAVWQGWIEEIFEALCAWQDLSRKKVGFGKESPDRIRQGWIVQHSTSVELTLGGGFDVAGRLLQQHVVARASETHRQGSGSLHLQQEAGRPFGKELGLRCKARRRDWAQGLLNFLSVESSLHVGQAWLLVLSLSDP
ncbi:Hypothetical predicted protein [Prunus dulcis]|uniref:Uncharacterized protein n=1 Tax=Prunus dulcis TaxID=3755 RepID=A0A5E4G8B0_PRUDU|nr:Hypothetical predicted protein [Prunus dulcis]